MSKSQCPKKSKRKVKSLLIKSGKTILENSNDMLRVANCEIFKNQIMKTTWYYFLLIFSIGYYNKIISRFNRIRKTSTNQLELKLF